MRVYLSHETKQNAIRLVFTIPTYLSVSRLLAQAIYMKKRKCDWIGLD